MRLPKSFYNPLSLVGVGIAFVMLGTIVVFFLVSTFGETTSPYLGILTYIIFPSFMIIGLLLSPVGMYLEHRRNLKPEKERRKYLIIDFNQTPHRLAFMIFTVGTMMLIVVSAAGTYQAYHYSESTEFCGEVCHDVMHPEYVAYQHSPHARVLCAECHIGTGADWFVKSKLTGAYQVYSVLFDKFSRPIETPIHNLRPARDTCEKCHWPQKFTNELKMSRTYFPLDTADSVPWKIVLALKIGGGQSELGPVNGIHWHMSTQSNVTYIATDHKRQNIPWIKSVGSDGSVKIFRSEESDFDEDELRQFEERSMDCIDCHNRPSHIYHPPFRTLNDAMTAGRISNDLPNIRSIASYAMTKKWKSMEDAVENIPHLIEDEYELAAPDVFKKQAAELKQSIAEILGIYQRNFFPDMNVDWRHYPNNKGHLFNDGCFRCHDNRHVTEDGDVIGNDCSTCHTIIAQGPPDDLEESLRGLEFRHPADVDEAWKEVRCVECHSGE